MVAKMSSAAGGAVPSEHLRVLVVDYSVGFGGATKSIGLVSQQLPNVAFRILTCQETEEYHRWYAGYPVHVFRRVFNYQNLSRIRGSLPRGITGYVGGKSISASTLASNMWNAVRLNGLLHRHPVDLIHLNNGFAPPEVLWVARWRGIPTVVHARGFSAPEDVRTYADRVSRIVAVSRSVADDIKAGGYPTELTSMIWDPVDLDLFMRTHKERTGIRATHCIADDEVAIGLFGRVVRWKGTLEFVRACSRALQAGARIRPFIVGDVSDGPQTYFDEVRAEVAQSDFADRFVFAGYQPEPAGYYHAMDIVAHTSIEPEPFGMVVPEGMAAGKPVIASAAGGPLELVEDGVDGILTPPGDLAALTAAIMKLASDPASRAQLGLHGQRKARDRFAVGPCAAALLAVWRSATAR